MIYSEEAMANIEECVARIGFCRVGKIYFSDGCYREVTIERSRALERHREHVMNNPELISPDCDRQEDNILLLRGHRYEVHIWNNRLEDACSMMHYEYLKPLIFGFISHEELQHILTNCFVCKLHPFCYQSSVFCMSKTERFLSIIATRYTTQVLFYFINRAHFFRG